jgi:putative nucleotidyltransferase with HDIG domain
LKTSRLQTFVGAVVFAGAAVAALQDWSSFASLPADHVFGLAVLIILGLFSEALSLDVEIGKDSGSTSVIFIPVLVALLLFGPAAALVVLLTAGISAELAIRKKPPIKVLFNAGQWAFACGIGGLVFEAMDGSTMLQSGSASWNQIFPFAAFALILVVLNNAAVAAVVAISNSLPVREVWRGLSGRAGANLLYDILVSPVAFGIAVLYLPLNVVGLLLAFFPLLFIRHSYFTNLRLQHANRDLLKALVKAIETRDPYTSGHSIRVASLARDIAVALGMSEREIDETETAALLHDIGKIDAIYVDIIQKPTDLTSAERAIIESHVTKGVELLRSLSSFPESVILAVRHHHEREDGRGYPDRLRGDQIPLAAKIIKVCDAVDAMLSDRPYRKALTLADVRVQLALYSGTQFDHRIAAVVSAGSILERHAAEVELRRGAGLTHVPIGRRTIQDSHLAIQ